MLGNLTLSFVTSPFNSNPLLEHMYLRLSFCRQPPHSCYKHSMVSYVSLMYDCTFVTNLAMTLILSESSITYLHSVNKLSCGRYLQIDQISSREPNITITNPSSHHSNG